MLRMSALFVPLFLVYTSLAEAGSATHGRPAMLASLDPVIMSYDWGMAAQEKGADGAVHIINPADKRLTPIEEAEKKILDTIEPADKDIEQQFDLMVQLFKEGRWGPAVGLALMLLVWALRKFIWKFVPSNALPWVTLAAGMVATVVGELLAGVVWWKTLIDGFATSGIAMGFWSLLFKHILGQKNPEEQA